VSASIEAPTLEIGFGTHHAKVVPEKEIYMLRAAISFFVLGLIAFLLGANGIAGLSIEIGRMLLVVFLILAVISFVFSLFNGNRHNH
jgi:uncharacterized membrane protein YtjA (UPF0391 family)